MATENVTIAEGQLEKLFAVAFAPVVALTELIKNSSDACIHKNDIIKIDIDTTHNTIRIKDNGSGLNKCDIKGLSTIGFSEKMTEWNTLSAIGEPYAGSKGLGFLTAFNLCKRLEIKTYSQIDSCGYKISWINGASKLTYEECNDLNMGTETMLYDVDDETIQFLTHDDELIKLYLSSITYYVDNENLPSVELYKDGTRLVLTPKEKIESLYRRNKKKRDKIGYFIAKGNFKYSQDKLILTYEDNILNLFNFADEELSLTNYDSLVSFARRHKIHIPKLRGWHDELLKLGPAIDDFEGVYYIWREKKDTSVDYPPCGIRIYVNNYGMYNYLDKDNDWLQHTAISQNVKFTNYKQQNTFGYVTFKHFNEATSRLKISQERNDFHVNFAQKKFMHIMRSFISGIFSQIDINIKNYIPDGSIFFEQKIDGRVIEEGQALWVADFVKTNLKLSQYEIIPDEGVIIDENGAIAMRTPGEYGLTFTYKDTSFLCKIIVRQKVPDFKLKKAIIKIDEGNSVNLRDQISSISLKHVDIYSIDISSNDADIQGDIFTGKNSPGEYTIIYTNDDFIPISKTLQINVKKTFLTESNQVKKLFPNSNSLTQTKIHDIISGISDAYMRHPILCMIALRTLIEICLREFLSKFAKASHEDFDETEKSLLSRYDIALKMAFEPQSRVAQEVQNKYKKYLSGKARRKLRDQLEALDLNTYVHNPAVNTTSDEVFNNLKTFKMLLNFLIESIVILET